MSTTGAPRVADRYLLQTSLGTDHLGERWSGADRLTDRPVVVTVIAAALLPDEPARQRARDAARRLVTLRHPGVISVRDYDDQPGRPSLVCDAAEGNWLSGVLAKKAWLEPGRMLQVLAQVGYALQAVHDAGLVHGSLDPSAVLLRPDGTAKLDVAGAVCAPGGLSSPAGDVSALGVLGYRMLGADPSAARQPAVPAAVAALLTDCLVSDPAQRPVAAEVSRRALALVAAGPEAVTKEVPPEEPHVAASRRPAPDQRRTRWVLAAIAAVVIVGGFVAMRQLAAASTATVPRLVGRPVAVALAALRHAGFGTKVTTSPARAPAGTVVALRPAAGSVLPEGSTVTVRVAAGPRSTAGPAEWRVGRTTGVGATATVSAVKHGD